MGGNACFYSDEETNLYDEDLRKVRKDLLSEDDQTHQQPVNPCMITTFGNTSRQLNLPRGQSSCRLWILMGPAAAFYSPDDFPRVRRWVH